MNQILLALPTRRKHTACVDARKLKSSKGGQLHYDTPAQNEIGQHYAAKIIELLTK